jgi:hypothetical protein
MTRMKMTMNEQEFSQFVPAYITNVGFNSFPDQALSLELGSSHEPHIDSADQKDTGRAVAFGNNDYGQCDVPELSRQGRIPKLVLPRGLQRMGGCPFQTPSYVSVCPHSCHCPPVSTSRPPYATGCHRVVGEMDIPADLQDRNIATRISAAARNQFGIARHEKPGIPHLFTNYTRH